MANNASVPAPPTQARTPRGINHLVLNVRDLEASHTNGRSTPATPQLSLFASTPPDDGLRRDLASLDVDAMSPLQAMTALYELRERARAGGGTDKPNEST